MTTKNPFPGMNPFFEQCWHDAQTLLIGYVRDTLGERLPSDLVARAEEAAVAIGGHPPRAPFRADVTVREPWQADEGGGVMVVAPIRDPSATQPTLILVDDKIERWIEIQDTTGRLITVIEFLSPSNKDGEQARDEYRKKRDTYMSGGMNVVEIGLVRRAASVFPAEVRDLARRKTAPYRVCVFRASRPNERGACFIRLHDRLPVISIPLRPTDADAAPEFQPLIDQCHERGRYHRLLYGEELDPPLAPADAAWVQEMLRQHELI
jgi:hypothetical protein